MTILPSLLRTLCLALLVGTCWLSLNTYGCSNGCGGTGIKSNINGVGGTGIRGTVLTKEQKKAMKAEKARQEAAERRLKEKRGVRTKHKEAGFKKPTYEIIKRRKAINTDYNLKKNALQIQCRSRKSHLTSQFQKQMLNFDTVLRRRLNSLPSTMNANQRLQSESRLKSYVLQQKRILNTNIKHRRLILKRECSDKAKILHRNFKLRIQKFERELQRK